MLLFPLILWWAHAPMRIANGRLRLAVSIVAIALIVIPAGNRMQSSFADDRFGRDRSRSGVAGIGDAGDPRLENAPKDFKQLREGTLIPPTVGQIVMLGRRWAFVSEQAESKSDDDTVAAEQLFRASMVGFNSKPRPTRLGAQSTTAIDSNLVQGATLVSDASNTDRSRVEEMPHIIISENLMLQRIVEAIRADTSDDRWTISGEVTEYFNENRLLIRTAQRANLK